VEKSSEKGASRHHVGAPLIGQIGLGETAARQR
jgi:hypothetical protein